VADKVCSFDIFVIIWAREGTVFGADSMVGAKGCDNGKGDEWYLALVSQVKFLYIVETKCTHAAN